MAGRLGIADRPLATVMVALAVGAMVAIGLGSLAGSQSPRSNRPSASRPHLHHLPPARSGSRSGSDAAPRLSAAAAAVDGLREVSYYPSMHPWADMWQAWQPSMIDSDMAKIAAVGANTVRIFLQPAAFGYPQPDGTHIRRLGQLSTIAAAHGLRVHLTLFDLWSDYGDIAGSRKWADAVLTPFHADRRIAAIELQNELDPTNPAATAWAHAMLPAIRSDSGLPITVSVSGWQTNSATALGRLVAALGRDQPDFYDIHFYGTPAFMLQTFRLAKVIAGSKPLIVGETGYSTSPANTSWIGAGHTAAMQEQAQAYYYSFAQKAARAAGLPAAGIWNLNDFPALPNVNAVEQHFGLYRLDGTPKAGAMRSPFAS